MQRCIGSSKEPPFPLCMWRKHSHIMRMPVCSSTHKVCPSLHVAAFALPVQQARECGGRAPTRHREPLRRTAIYQRVSAGLRLSCEQLVIMPFNATRGWRCGKRGSFLVRMRLPAIGCLACRHVLQCGRCLHFDLSTLAVPPAGWSRGAAPLQATTPAATARTSSQAALSSSRRHLGGVWAGSTAVAGNTDVWHIASRTHACYV